MKTLLRILLILTVFGAEVKSQTTLTIGQVYDYNINDQFHYYAYGVSPNATRFTVTDKQFSALNDTVTYVRHFDNYSSQVISDPSPHLEYFFDSYTDTLSITNLDSLISDQFSTWTTNDSLGDWFNDSSYISSQWCGILIYEYSACLGCNFEGNSYQGQYGQGVGLIKQIHQSPAWPQIDYQYYLKYYKKGTVSCGTPDLTTVGIKEPLKKVADFFIYPNPVESTFTLQNESPYDNFQCSLQNLLGQIIMTINLRGETNIIDISNFEGGIYQLVITTGDKISTIKIIKE
jgi:hypothetical protein